MLASSSYRVIRCESWWLVVKTNTCTPTVTVIIQGDIAMAWQREVLMILLLSQMYTHSVLQGSHKPG